ncbi:uncharacterized protein TNIN_25671, partial [Trichonephila inaurata madagascariensis]
MNCFCNLDKSARQETSVITLTEEHSPVTTNFRHPNSNIPILLHKCLNWSGLVEKPTRHPLDCIVAISFKITLILVNLDWLISSGVSFHSLDWKTIFTNFSTYMLVAGTYLVMYSKRKLLTVTLHSLGSSSNEKTVNFILIVICSIPAVLSTFRVKAFHANPMSSQIETYGYTIENGLIRIMLLSLKSLLHAIVRPTFTSLVTLTYCILCQHCCSQINFLTEKVLQFSHEEFDPTKQIDILRQKAKIDKLLESVQAIFSVPSFLLIAMHFLMFVSVIRTTIEVGGELFLSYVTVEAIIRSLTDFNCLFFLLWIASGVSIQTKKLKREFSEKVRARL